MSNDSVSDDFDLDGVDPEAPGSYSGGGKLPEGGYKFSITEVLVKNEKGSTQVECEVLDAKDDKLIGRKHIEYLPWPDGEHNADYNRIKKEQLLAWCYAAKTTSAEEVAARQKAKQKFNLGWLEQMVGRVVLGFVKVESYTGRDGSEKTSAKCEGRVWALDNPKGKGLPGWIDTGAGKTNQSQQQQKQPPKDPPPSDVDPFAGLV